MNLTANLTLLICEKDKKMKCPNCNEKLKYEAEVAAPGHGQSWSCSRCGNIYYKKGKKLTNWRDVDPQIFEGY